MMEKAYSINGDEFPFLSPHDALQALSDEGELIVGRVYYEIDIEAARHLRYLAADRILDLAEESMADEVGEAAEGAFDVSQEAEIELNSLLAEWAARHTKGNYWRCVGRARELIVSAQDVEEIERAPAQGSVHG